MPISLSNAHYPLIIATVSGNLTDAEYTDHLKEFVAMALERGNRYAYVYDGRRTTAMKPSTRKLQADWIAAHRLEIQRLSVGVGFVLEDPIARGILIAIHWLARPPYPFTVVGSRGSAIDWCLTRLAEEGVPLPPGVAQASGW